MDAFYRHEGKLIKAHDDGEDWEMSVDDGRTFCFSLWPQMRRASLVRAISNTCRLVGIPYDQGKVVFCGDNADGYHA